MEETERSTLNVQRSMESCGDAFFRLETLDVERCALKVSPFS
jgi:hypothetical protein